MDKNKYFGFLEQKMGKIPLGRLRRPNSELEIFETKKVFYPLGASRPICAFGALTSFARLGCLVSTWNRVIMCLWLIFVNSKLVQMQLGYRFAIKSKEKL